jgi:hypothetical protein
MNPFRTRQTEVPIPIAGAVDPKEQRSPRKIQTVASAASATVHDNLIGCSSHSNRPQQAEDDGIKGARSRLPSTSPALNRHRR